MICVACKVCEPNFSAVYEIKNPDLPNENLLNVTPRLNKS